eukprot:1158212-Pelagomonas_calceolata.AAC.8
MGLSLSKDVSTWLLGTTAKTLCTPTWRGKDKNKKHLWQPEHVGRNHHRWPSIAHQGSGSHSRCCYCGILSAFVKILVNAFATC